MITLMLVMSDAVESALADAYRFSGGPLPSRGLVLGRGSASFRLVRLGGHKVWKARGSAADAHDAADVFLYRDSSIAPLLDMRRRFKAVMEILEAMIRYGIFLGLLNYLLNGIGFLLLGLCILLLLMIFMWSGVLDLVISIMSFAMFVVVLVIFFMQLLFIVGMKPLGVGGIGFGRILLFTRLSGFVKIWFPLLLFFSVSPICHLVVLVFYLIQLGLTRNSERPGSSLFLPFWAKGYQP